MRRSNYLAVNPNMRVGSGNNGSRVVVSEARTVSRSKRTAASQEDIAAIEGIIKNLNVCKNETNSQAYDLRLTETYRDLRALARKSFER